VFNIGGAEFLVIALVALIVLGPDKLPEAARKVGNITAELRRMSNGFRHEMQSAFNEPDDTAARERGRRVVEESRREAASRTDTAPSDTAPTDTGPTETPSDGSGGETPTEAPSE
jgi:sec-independent protein translocase protein TatB